MKLHEIQAPPGANKRTKRVGRGPGSGHGKTSTRGHKGQKARSGGGVRPGFEGGQMPLIRRVPKRGFTNIFRVEVEIVNVAALNRFDDGTVVDIDTLKKAGMVRNRAANVKILGKGDLTKKLTVKATAFSKSAIEKIQAAGGATETIASA